MRQPGDVRIVRGEVEELLAMARDLLGAAFCVAVMVSGTFLLGRWG